jgi:putative salt-induced outer membrane protein YdiY
MLRNQFHPEQFRLIFLILFVIISCVSAAEAKRNDDMVILKNGDRLTGEIKGLQRGELKFKASYMAEAVRLDWSKVARLESKDRYLITLTGGQLFTDFLRLAPAGATADNFLIGGETGAVRVRQLEVLKITPVEARFLRQLEGTIDFGFSFTSGNDQYETEFSASVTYRRQAHSLTAGLDSVFSGQPKGESSARNQFNLDYRKQLSPKWYAGGLFDLLRSDQQSLSLRTTVGGLIGRNLLQTERTRLSFFGGLATTRENYSAPTDNPQTTNMDALAGLDFSTVRFSATDITSRFILYPSLTTPGRKRMQFKSNLRIKLVKDLYWGLHVYENFDSKPPVKADKNDLGISTSLGWKF